MPKKKNNLFWYALAAIVLIAVFSPSTINDILSNLSVVGQYNNYLKWDCVRTGESVSCASTQTAKWGCSQMYAAGKYGFCATSDIQQIGNDVQNILNETGILTDAEKQSFYNSLSFGGSCRLAYQNGLEKNSEGTCGSPTYSGTSQSYSGLGCTKEFGVCKSVTVPDFCGGSATTNVQMTLMLGSYHTTPYSETNDLGSCSFSGTLPKKMAAVITENATNTTINPPTLENTTQIPAISATNTTTYYTCPSGYTLVNSAAPYCIPNSAEYTQGIQCQDPSPFQKCQADGKMYRIIYNLDASTSVCKGQYDWYNCVYSPPTMIQPQSSSASYPVKNLGADMNTTQNNVWVYAVGLIGLAAGVFFFIRRKK